MPSPADVTIRMASTGTIRGKVTKPDGSPAADAQVSVNPEGNPVGKWGGGTNVKPDGTFQFDNVPPGKYTISVSPHLARVGKDPEAREIEVKPGETAEATMTKR